MTKLSKIINALVKDGTTDLGELYKIALDQTANWKPRPEPEELEKVIHETVEAHKKSTEIGIKLVSEWVLEEPGEFSLSMAYKGVGIYDFPKDRWTLLENIVRENLRRLVQRGVIEHTSKRRGVYRKVEQQVEALEWASAPTEPMEVSLPFDLDQIVNIYKGNVLIVAGEKDTGKTSFCLDFIRRNMGKYELHYFTSEMGATELKNRLVLHEDMKLEDWKFHAWNRAGEFSDAVKKDKVNVIDFLETDAEKPYLVKNEIRHIFDKLGDGIALIAIQKYPGKEFGYGGAGSIEKARLYVTLAKNPDHTGSTAKIVSAKSWKQGGQNPNGKIMRYSLINGAKFIYSGSWEYQESHDALKPRRIFR